MIAAVDDRKAILIIDGGSGKIRSKRLKETACWLKDDGYRVVTAASFQEAIGVIQGLQPDLLLLSLLEMSSEAMETCKQLKQNEYFQKLPLILCIENADDRTLQAVVEAGALDYLCDPFIRVELLMRIKSAMIQDQLSKEQLIERKARECLKKAGVLCHELNQPMQAVMGFSQLMMMDKVMVDSPQFKQVNNIYQQVERMGEIIRKLMGVTRLNSKGFVADTRIE